jgi:hypothetical protein
MEVLESKTDGLMDRIDELLKESELKLEELTTTKTVSGQADPKDESSDANLQTKDGQAG